MKQLCLVIITLATVWAAEKKDKRGLYNFDSVNNLNYGDSFTDTNYGPLDFDVNLKSAPHSLSSYEVREPSVELSSKIFSAPISVAKAILPLTGPAPLASGNSFKSSYSGPVYTKANIGPLFRESIPASRRLYIPPVITKTIENYAADRADRANSYQQLAALNVQPVFNEQYVQTPIIKQNSFEPVSYTSQLGHGHGYTYSKIY